MQISGPVTKYKKFDNEWPKKCVDWIELTGKSLLASTVVKPSVNTAPQTPLQCGEHLVAVWYDDDSNALQWYLEVVVLKKDKCMCLTWREAIEKVLDGCFQMKQMSMKHKQSRYYYKIYKFRTVLQQWSDVSFRQKHYKQLVTCLTSTKTLRAWKTKLMSLRCTYQFELLNVVSFFVSSV